VYAARRFTQDQEFRNNMGSMSEVMSQFVSEVDRLEGRPSRSVPAATNPLFSEAAAPGPSVPPQVLPLPLT
jgi:hypothetical protein